MSGATLSGAALLGAVRAQRVVPLFYEPDAARAADAVAGLAEGGASVIEYTLRGPGADRVLAHLVAGAPAGVAVGAGSVRDVAGAHTALDAGAAFVVGPNGDPAVAELCAERGVGYVPGTLTPSEMVAALSWGCPLVKVFPIAAVGGPAYVKAVRGPLPSLQVMATGGVGPADLRAYLDAGVACVGMGSELVKKAWVQSGDAAALAAAMRAILADAGADGASQG
ncbi:MAG: bifunctional 4-hydroxy-2-oxoglutarate aldolase/2-dehydro-3-deoxy-phosphogluconate aldolase [Trueperaceae bacterium]